MPRFLCEVQYLGTNYSGWQIQKNSLSIQEVIQKHCSLVFGSETKIEGTSRTDAGVHSEGQLFFFDSEPVPQKRFELLFKSLNALLPEDIKITRWIETSPGFNPRQVNLGKHYRYIILNSMIREVFHKTTAWWVRRPVDLEKMKEASPDLIGEHDFSGFAGKNAYRANPVKTLSKIEFSEKNTRSGKLILIDFFGNSFLKQMVRIIAGTLVDIGQSKLDKSVFSKTFESKLRKDLGRTAPPEGLVLKKIYLNPDPFP